MHFFQTLVVHNYLYSPKGWLHKQRNILKVLFVFISITIIPYICLFKILICITIYLLLYKINSFPSIITSSLYNLFSFIVCFLAISIENEQKIFQNYNIGRKYVIILPVTENFLQEIKNTQMYKPTFGLPLTLVRLLSITYFYLTATKILLLTTTHQNIIQCFMNNINQYVKISYQRLMFECQISITFLNTMFQQIEQIRESIFIRKVKFKRSFSFRNYLVLYHFSLQRGIINTYNNIYNISNAIHQNEVSLDNLNVIYLAVKQ